MTTRLQNLLARGRKTLETKTEQGKAAKVKLGR